MPECSRLYYDASMVATNAGCYQVAVGAEYRSDEYGWVVCTHPDVEGDWVELASWPWNKFMYGQDMPVNYTGLTYVAYTVLPRPVVEAQAEFVLPLNLIYDGSAKVLAGLTITNDYTGAVLQEGVDYDVVYSDNVNPGMATATVVCKGNYAGTLARTFEILPTSFSLSGCDGGGFAGESGSLTGYAGEYDGEGHGLAVDVSAIGDVTAKFAMAEEGPFVDSLLLTNICDQTVWVELSALGYNSFTGFAQVVISARPITNVTIEAQNIVRSAGGVPELVYSVYDPCLGRSLVDGVDYVAAIARRHRG